MKSALTCVLACSLVVLSLALAADAPSASAVVCTAVADRAPVGAAEVFSADVGTLLCFSEVRNAGDAIEHVWFQGDREVLRVKLAVRAARWRTWSEKTIRPGSAGPWRVEVRDRDGAVLATTAFRIE